LFIPIQASAKEPYERFIEARETTLSACILHISGQETVTPLSGAAQTYTLRGHIKPKEETLLIIGDAATLIRGSRIYTYHNNAWVEKTLTGLLNQFTLMGVLDQFFVLELLTGDNPELYKPYMTAEENAIGITLTRQQFTALFNEWTSDLRTLLGAAADGVSDTEISLMRRMFRTVLSGLEAQGTFTFRIDPQTGAITRIETEIRTVDPTVRAGQNTNIKDRTRLSQSVIYLQ
jgi:hypothetical protein